jgi:2-polyprenyl-3-methyl-5-hydroxy-6-metoxy-1,4-benzoquinol methylase
MNGLPDLRLRSVERELMDDPERDPALLLRTVRQIELLNRLVSGSRRLLRRLILKDMLRGPPGDYTLLDLGAGGCDLGRWMARHLRRSSRRLRVTCLDKDLDTVAYARRRLGDTEAVEVKRGTAFDLATMGRYDYVMAHNFLHHLTDGEAGTMIGLMADRCRRIFVVMDLHRSRWAYVAFYLFAAVLIRRSFGREDGRRSIRRGFRRPELEQLLSRHVGPDIPARVFRAFPARVCVVGGPALRGRAPS